MNQNLFDQMNGYILIMNSLNEQEEQMITENQLEELPEIEIKQAEVYELYYKFVHDNFGRELIDQANESIGNEFISLSFSKKLKDLVDETFFPIDQENVYSLNRKGMITQTTTLYFINKEGESSYGQFYAVDDLEAMFFFRSAIDKRLIEILLVYQD